MKMEEQQHGAVTVVKVDGPLIDNDAALFLEKMTHLARERMGRIVIDTSKVPYADSKGLEAILDISEALGESGQNLRLCGSTETLREVLELTGLAEQVDQFEDATAAVRSFL